MKTMKAFILVATLNLISNLAFAQGCFLLGSGDLPSSNYQLFATLQNPSLDSYVSRDVRVLRTFFNVQPSFFYYVDDSPNAFAVHSAQLSSYPSGTVCFGRNLFNREWAKSGNLTTIPVIIAHEFGHIVDFNYHAIPTDAVTMKKELFADFMAGVFLKYRSSLTLTDINGTLRSFFSIGDYDFNSPDHHGTPSQRLAAITAGFNWFGNQSSNVGVTDMVRAGRSYIARIFRDDDDNTSPKRDDNDDSNSSTLSRHVSAFSELLNYPNRDGSTHYYYKISVRNHNDADVQVTLGGLKYGYYANCNASEDNFVEQGNFEEKTVTVSARGSRVVYVSVDLPNYPPNRCSGVPSGQEVKVVSVEKD
jgi:hypothetical protein